MPAAAALGYAGSEIDIMARRRDVPLRGKHDSQAWTARSPSAMSPSAVHNECAPPSTDAQFS